jgi:DNA-binding transcriptional MerR regulator
MGHEGITVSDLVERAGPGSDAQRQLWLRRLRYWSAHGVLSSEEPRHGGTGKHRRYGPETAYLAALLLRLSSAGLPIGVIEAVAQVVQRELRDPANFPGTASAQESLKDAWNAARRGQDSHLGLVYSEAGIEHGPVLLQVHVIGKDLKSLVGVDAYPVTIVNLGAIFGGMKD